MKHWQLTCSRRRIAKRPRCPAESRRFLSVHTYLHPGPEKSRSMDTEARKTQHAAFAKGPYRYNCSAREWCPFSRPISAVTSVAAREDEIPSMADDDCMASGHIVVSAQARARMLPVAFGIAKPLDHAHAALVRAIAASRTDDSLVMSH